MPARALRRTRRGGSKRLFAEDVQALQRVAVAGCFVAAAVRHARGSLDTEVAVVVRRVPREDYAASGNSATLTDLDAVVAVHCRDVPDELRGAAPQVDVDAVETCVPDVVLNNRPATAAEDQLPRLFAGLRVTLCRLAAKHRMASGTRLSDPLTSACLP
jgi:hypothetical protein